MATGSARREKELAMLEQDMSALNVETLFVGDDSTDRTNAGEDTILSLTESTCYNFRCATC